MSPLPAWRAYIFLPFFSFSPPPPPPPPPPPVPSFLSPFFFQLTRLILHVKRTFDVAATRTLLRTRTRDARWWRCRGGSPARGVQADACGLGRLF